MSTYDLIVRRGTRVFAGVRRLHVALNAMCESLVGHANTVHLR